jgi:hypothetical protein
MSTRIGIDAIRDCLEGVIPATVATCAPDGTPNVSYVSQLNYVDANHVALTFQFFNKTRQNVLANPRAAVLLVDPQTAARYRLDLQYLRTETEGPLFESMKAKLAGIASHTGMSTRCWTSPSCPGRSCRHARRAGISWRRCAPAPRSSRAGPTWRCCSRSCSRRSRRTST